MTSPFVPVHTGRYLRDTPHLTPEEQHSLLSSIVNARNRGEIESLRRVLDEFFIRTEDGWPPSRSYDRTESTS